MSKLRVGVLLDSLELYAWEYAMLKRIADSGYADLALVVLSSHTCARSAEALDPRPVSTNFWARAIGGVLLAAYRALEAKVECARDAFALVDGNAVFHGIPVVQATTPTLTLPLKGRECLILPPQGGTEAPRIGIRGWDGGGSIDVFIDLSARPLDGRVTAAAQYGVWSLKHTHCRTGDAAAAGFWPVYYNWPATESQLVSREGKCCRVLARSFSGTNRFSVKLNRSALFWKTSSLVPRKLEELQRLGPDAFFRRVEQANGSAVACEQVPLDSPTNAQLLAHIARNVRRRSGDFLFRNLALDRWVLLVHAGEELSTSIQNFRKIVPPKDRFWADPHVVRKGDRFYVFVEEFMFSTRKGHIAVLVVDREGRLEGSSHTVLKRDYHMSYPFVFEHENGFFMIPESSDNRTVDLYRCVEFPSKWEYVTTLLEDILAVDSTMLHHDGKWWLFTNIVENEGASFCEELFLFHSESLVDGKWTPHAGNPIVSDVRKARPAGAIIRRDGSLYRPAQDCSVRYGYGMTINHISAISEDDYAESTVETITPTWDKSIVATHTLAYTPGLTVIDALQPRLKL